ncbi:putative pyrimidine monooxygenase ruta [Pseudomassariella vexata]|uniref:Putative pyrimidine monooxygenase ruta n=1 Tax=Pseudomassariella vexata TaxID=1141098 RepID=A0A1Y2EG53_9PEZI|nr:putative pyrimidine monooxygenase ruta [Pseudomassariella vexata]ORY70397.1 putative pyrimidine monooxygenase ruta [Pseudomassariella vexata]
MVKPLDVGIFIPIGNDGWLISTTAPHYMPTFELNRDIVLKAESYGFDFALSMIKLRGFGGKTEHWDHNLESFTLMAGIAAVTKKIKLFASTAILTLPPALCARMATTIDSIAPGRFGVNIVTGWQAAEYEQMSLWPGDEYFGYRYDYAEEYVHVMKDLWNKGSSDFKGKHFQMHDCKLSPQPSGKVSVIAAGQSNRGIKFAAEYADYNFCTAKGINTPTAFAPANQRLVDAAKETSRDVGAMVLIMCIADETDEAALAKWNKYREGTDHEALAWIAEQTGKDTQADQLSTARRLVSSTGDKVNMNGGTLVASYAGVAQMLDEVSDVEGVKGVMLTFDEFLTGVDNFGKYIQPLMKSRSKANGLS